MRSSPRFMAYTASAMYGAAGLDGLIEGFLPGDPKFALVPVVVVLVIFAGLITVGPRLPCRVLAALGPLGVALIVYALATTPGAGDGAVLYALPVLWMTLFFGRRGAVWSIACVGVGHALVLIFLPASSSYPGRWVDVMVSVCSIALVVLTLQRHTEQLLARLAGEARTDSLTGLLNRRGFDERTEIELAHTRRDRKPLALATFDIDYFKHINDEWGHEIGDQVLAFIGRILMSESREIDVCARLGGEEFAVLLPGCDAAAARSFTERIRRALSAGRPGLPSVRISAGVVASLAPTTVHDLLLKADSALYEAKRAGRDRTVTCSVTAPPHAAVGGSPV